MLARLTLPRLNSKNMFRHLRRCESIASLVTTRATPSSPPPLPLANAQSAAFEQIIAAQMQQMRELLAAASAERAVASAAQEVLLAEYKRKDEAASAERAAASAAQEVLLAEFKRKDEAASAERAAASAVQERLRESLQRKEKAASAEREAHLRFKLDLSVGAVRARSLYERSLMDITHNLPAKSKALLISASARQAKLLDGHICPALPSYIYAVARANGAKGDVVLAQARRLYDALSRPLHSVQNIDAPLPVALFDRDQGNEALLAFVAVVRFSGRNPALYVEGGQRKEIALPLPPQSCSDTIELGEAAAAAAAARAADAVVVPVAVNILDESAMPYAEESPDDS